MKLNNKSLNSYIKYKLSYQDDSFSMNDLNKIDELIINNKVITDDYEIFNFNDLLLFNNIEHLTLRFFYIDINTINILNKLNKLCNIVFDNCSITDIKYLNKINKLNFINCKFNINDLKYINSINELSITNSNIDINIINNFNNLKYLNISNSYINGNINLLNIETLIIDNTNINDFSFINNLINLKYLTIDDIQYINNKNYFDSLNISINITDGGIK